VKNQIKTAQSAVSSTPKGFDMPPNASYSGSKSVEQFCSDNGISRTHYYELVKRDQAPESMKLGLRRLIPLWAELEWQQRMCAMNNQAQA
jgi:predicted DNA-binding transcriptional regulator AlpA